jgi:hypothetical protein
MNDCMIYELTKQRHADIIEQGAPFADDQVPGLPRRLDPGDHCEAAR